MCLSSSIKPFFARTFSNYYLFSSVRVKDFCAAPRKRIKPCTLEPQQDFLNRVSCYPGNEEYLCWRKRFDRDTCKFSFDRSHHFFIVVKPQFWVKASNNVKLSSTKLLYCYF